MASIALALGLLCLLLIATIIDSNRMMRKRGEEHLDYVRKTERERLALVREKLELAARLQSLETVKTLEIWRRDS